MSTEQADVVIIGGGPAGLTASIYAAGMKLKSILLEGKVLGGRTTMAPHVWNFPGFPQEIKGSELVQLMVKQAENYGAVIKIPIEVINLELDRDPKLVVTRSDTYEAHAVIVATGTQSRKLHLPGEEEYVGRGVSYCPVCDAPLYRGLKAGVIGSGYEAFEDALYLANFADQVLLLTHAPEIKAEPDLVQKVEEKSNIKILKGNLTSILGDEFVTAITYAPNDQEIEMNLKVDGVFISLGGVPMTALVKSTGVEVDKRGCIKVDRRQVTNIEGVFAAGDCTCGGMQIITAAGEGAMAAIQAHRYIKRLKASK
jgi:thioredoxin reductase (NADPH)